MIDLSTMCDIGYQFTRTTPSTSIQFVSFDEGSQYLLRNFLKKARKATKEDECQNERSKCLMQSKDENC